MVDAVKRFTGISIEGIDRVVETAFRSSTAFLLWGPPGVGKTRRTRAAVANLASRLSRHGLRLGYLEMTPATYTAADFGGYPVSNPERRTIELQPLHEFAFLTECDAAIVFLDEFNSADPDTFKAMLRLLSEKRVGQLRLPDATAFIAAANPFHQATATIEFGENVADRFTQLFVHVNPNEFIKGFPSYWGNPPTLAHNVDIPASLLSDTWASVRAEIATFLSIRPDLVWKPPVDVPDRTIRTPNPRAWDAVSRYLALIEVERIIKQEKRKHLSDDPGLMAYVAGRIGPDAATEFLAWYVKRDIPSFSQILEDPANAPIPEHRDAVFATVKGLCAALSARLIFGPDAVQASSATAIYLQRVLDKDPSFSDMVAASLDEVLIEDRRRRAFLTAIEQSGIGPGSAIGNLLRKMWQARHLVREAIAREL